MIECCEHFNFSRPSTLDTCTEVIKQERHKRTSDYQLSKCDNSEVMNSKPISYLFGVYPLGFLSKNYWN